MESPGFHPTSDLVGAFLEAAQSVLGSHDPAILAALPAELTYELDQVVSDYLAANEISPVHYQSIHQDVVNSLATNLIGDSDSGSELFTFDDFGNAGLTDVLAYLDHHHGLPDSLASGLDSSPDQSGPDLFAGHG